MPCSTMRERCRHPGNAYRERGIVVRVTPRQGETWKWFAIDDQTNRPCALRAELHICGALSDLLVFYTPEGSASTTICIVELKGSDITHAIEQVINTLQSLAPHFNANHAQPLRQQTTWKAYICTRGSAPQFHSPQSRRLLHAFGHGNFAIQQNPDLGQFLRQH